jgi:hypothetical protein
MGKKYESINSDQVEFITARKIFFCATAAPTGRVNLSPKGGDTLRVLGSDRVVWINMTGSGNETAAHLLEDPRMTLMFCAFEGDPKILRLYGSARAVTPTDADWDELAGLFDAGPGARQVFDMRVDLVQTSCGFGVPYFDYAGDRDDLQRWAERKGEDGVRQYWQLKNSRSLDGRDTGMVVETDDSAE